MLFVCAGIATPVCFLAVAAIECFQGIAVVGIRKQTDDIANHASSSCCSAVGPGRCFGHCRQKLACLQRKADARLVPLALRLPPPPRLCGPLVDCTAWAVLNASALESFAAFSRWPE
jgi:hypothetical protein